MPNRQQRQRLPGAPDHAAYGTVAKGGTAPLSEAVGFGPLRGLDRAGARRRACRDRPRVMNASCHNAQGDGMLRASCAVTAPLCLVAHSITPGTSCRSGIAAQWPAVRVPLQDAANGILKPAQRVLRILHCSYRDGRHPARRCQLLSVGRNRGVAGRGPVPSLPTTIFRQKTACKSDCVTCLPWR